MTDAIESSISLKAPLSGMLYKLEDIPDPVFSQKMMGDGISIDPTSNKVLAPFDGTIKHFHKAKHALTLETGDGIEVLIHVGIDTVNLEGKGFRALVSTGDRVLQGDALIEFDLDKVAQGAKSLLTEIIFTNLTDQKLALKSGAVLAGKDDICTLQSLQGAKTSNEAVSTGQFEELSAEVIVGFDHGIHARPAARVVSLAKSFQSDVTVIAGNRSEFLKNKKSKMREANAKSLVGLLELEIGRQETCTVVASGPDAANALEAIVGLLQTEEEAAPLTKKAEKTPVRKGSETLVLGVGAAPGQTYGVLFQMASQSFENIRELIQAPETAKTESKRFFDALETAQVQIKNLEDKMAQDHSDESAIFAAHAEILQDPDLVIPTKELIQNGYTAAYAWQKTFSNVANRLVALKNELFAARANDIKDVGQRVLKILVGGTQKTTQTPKNAIVIAEDLTPSMVVELDTNKVVGFCTTGGGPTSHVAILARSLNLPAIAGIEKRVLTLENGRPALMNGESGELQLDPPKDVIDAAQKEAAQKEKEHQIALKTSSEPALTKDGKRMQVLANVSGLEETKKAVELGGEGVGLLRSEFLFLNRSTAPSFKEQKELYRALSVAIRKENPLVVRTLDVGGDKPLPYLPQEAEENPFLGIRGARLSLRRQDIFREQVRAILEASDLGNLQIMFPMVGKLDEMRQLRQIVNEETEAVGCDKVPCGIMVEVPSAALLADQFAKEVDFFSIGTNDLAQYTLAMDRNHHELASQVDALDPAVLKLIQFTAQAGIKHNIPVSVCGGIASDVVAIPILIGLGITKFSASSPAVPEVKALIRKCTGKDCEELAKKALHATDAKAVRELSKNYMKENFA